jgi:hypothetical protein
MYIFGLLSYLQVVQVSCVYSLRIVFYFIHDIVLLVTLHRRKLHHTSYTYMIVRFVLVVDNDETIVIILNAAMDISDFAFTENKKHKYTHASSSTSTSQSQSSY